MYLTNDFIENLSLKFVLLELLNCAQTWQPSHLRVDLSELVSF